MVLRCICEEELIAKINVSTGIPWIAVSSELGKDWFAVRGLSWNSYVYVAVVHEISHPPIGYFEHIYTVVARQ